MRETAPNTVTFGPFVLNVTQRQLHELGSQVRLGSRAMAILVALVSRPGELVSKNDLIDSVWPDATVDESALRVHLSALRKVLGTTSDGGPYIVNDTGRGYRFNVPLGEEPPHPQQPQPATQTTALPLSVARMFGRDDVVTTLVDLLPARRLLTIAGPGGIGKTTVALATARRFAEVHNVPTVFVDLAPVMDPGLVVASVASLIGVAPAAKDPLASLLDALGDKPVLLLIDNCEHLIDAVAALAEAMTQRSPSVLLLITSREPMRAAGEWVHRLATLGIPGADLTPTVEAISAFPSVQLFCEKATASAEEFRLTEREAPHIAEICRRLDGIPLAIEMAAARIDMLDVQTLARRLDDRFAVLTTGRRAALPRQQTLRATLDWSHDLLTDTEKTVFRRLSVFTSSFSLAAASYVAHCSEVERDQVFDALTALVSKSLVTKERRDDGFAFRLLDTTRHYGAEQLRATDEEVDYRRKHARYCIDMFDGADGAWEGKDPARWLSVLRPRIDDIRSALQWALSDVGDARIALDLVVAAAPLFFHMSLPDEYLRLAERTMASIAGSSLEGSPHEVELLMCYGHALWHTRGPFAEMAEAFNRARSIAAAIGSTALSIRASWGQWAQAILAGDYRISLAHAIDLERLGHQSADVASLITANHMLALSEHFRGNFATSEARLERVITSDASPVRANHTNHAQVDGKIAVQSLLMRNLWIKGDAAAAFDLASACAHDALSLDHDLSICYGLAIGAIPVAIWTGQLETARTLLPHLLARTIRKGLTHWGAWARGFAAALGDRTVDFASGATQMQLEVFATLSDATFATCLPDRLATEPGLWCGAEILRRNAVRRTSIGDNEKISLLRDARQLAGSQGALAFELRSATSLAELLVRQGRRSDAIAELSPIVGRMASGGDTADLRVATAVLNASAKTASLSGLI
jgi:predicted ATPase/DNA-binding winged helix-turn-helix (wHTH) protein